MCPERNQRSVKLMTTTVQLILVALRSEQQLTLAVGCVWFYLVALWMCFSGFVAQEQFQNLKRKPVSAAGASSIWVEMLLSEISCTTGRRWRYQLTSNQMLLRVFSIFSFRSLQYSFSLRKWKKFQSTVSNVWTVSGFHRQVSTLKVSGRSSSCCLSLHPHSLLAVKPIMQCRTHLRHRSKS